MTALAGTFSQPWRLFSIDLITADKVSRWVYCKRYAVFFFSFFAWFWSMVTLALLAELFNKQTTWMCSVFITESWRERNNWLTDTATAIQTFRPTQSPSRPWCVPVGKLLILPATASNLYLTLIIEDDFPSMARCFFSKFPFLSRYFIG